MLSASILSSSLCHTLGETQVFYEKYCQKQASDFSQLPAIDLSTLQSLLPKTNLRRVPTYARMGLFSALKTLNTAKENPDFAPQNMALVIGTAFSSSQMNVDFMDSILENGPELSSPTAFSHAVNNMGAGLISLILDIKGGCQTVTQFDYSFAGAVQTALLLLASGKNDYVLVGAIDEIDKRFLYTCKSQLQSTIFAFTQGAVFFLLGKKEENKAQISISWKNIKDIEHILSENKDKNVFFSGFYEDCLEIQSKDKKIKLNAPFYGTTPLAQALDTALALNVKENFSSSLCVCKQKNSDLLAVLEINN